MNKICNSAFQHNIKRKPAGFWVASTKASPAKINMSLSHLSGHTWNTVFSFGPYYAKKDVDSLERVQRRVRKVIRGLGSQP